jgi:hypothetical protein
LRVSLESATSTQGIRSCCLCKNPIHHLQQLQESQVELRNTEAISRKQCFIVQAQTHPKVEPREQRGLTLYTLARLQKQKARSNPYMVIFNSIGYFTLMLGNFSPPQCYVTFSTFRFLRFYLSAMPSLPPCYFIRIQA